MRSSPFSVPSRGTTPAPHAVECGSQRRVHDGNTLAQARRQLSGDQRRSHAGRFQLSVLALPGSNTASQGTLHLHPEGLSGAVARLLATLGLRSPLAAHNQQSGLVEPNQADIEITQLLQEAFKLVEVHLLDHPVVSPYECISLAERALVMVTLRSSQPTSTSLKRHPLKVADKTTPCTLTLQNHLKS